MPKDDEGISEWRRRKNRDTALRLLGVLLLALLLVGYLYARGQSGGGGAGTGKKCGDSYISRDKNCTK